MSDEPSDAQKLIAEVMVTHALVYDDWAVVDADFYTCACGWRLSSSASVHDHAAHVAVEVDKALGGLTRQRRKILASGVILSADAEGWEGYATRQSRFASGWTVTE
ncbi:hypothetical protein [Mycobacteroides abscessus]|uniref:hypothetical protein n=1 Tax=Mycobacteroides abscessus TaxID=36809 RepID=UPI001C6AB55C|nr:hypothetical protein [Mycobacteroides abscessus]